MSDEKYARVMMKILDMAMDEYETARNDMIEIVNQFYMMDEQELKTKYDTYGDLLYDIMTEMEKRKNE